ncbi:MAG: phage minor head protein [Rikenellaceae bacterium]
MGLHERAEHLYQGGALELAAPGDIPNTDEVEEAFSSAMEWLHGNRLFSGAMLTEDPVRSLIDATSTHLYKGIDRGLEQSAPSELLVSKLKESARVFSGFKTLHEMNEAAALLLDEKGYIKPFERFSKDVQTINSKYNKSYLRTEYEFTVASSQMAAKWEEQQDDGGGRYLLQYRTMGDKKVRADHVKLDGVTLAPSDPFWESYYPPNGWGCRCTVVKVRATKYPATDSEDAMTAGAEATKGKYSDMFRFNPGKHKTVYPAHNSYTISKCSTCSKSKLELAKIPSNELCAACPIVREMAKVKVRELKIKAAQKLLGTTVKHSEFKDDIHFTRRGIKEYLNQPHKHYYEKNELILDIDRVLENSRYMGYTDYKSTKFDPVSHIFETHIMGDKTWLIVKENAQIGSYLYSISDGEAILKGIKNDI